MNFTQEEIHDVAIAIHRVRCPLRDDSNHDCGRAAPFEHDRARAALEAAVTVVASERERLRQLHKPIDRGRVMNCCEGCETVNGDFHEDCCHEWPCPTIDLLEPAP